MSNEQNDNYKEYMYEMNKEHDERENRLAGELAQHEGEGKEPDEGFDDEESPIVCGDPMIDYSPQDELDMVTNRESYQFFRGY